MASEPDQKDKPTPHPKLRRETFSIEHALRRAESIWYLLLLSLPFDFFLLSITLPPQLTAIVSDSIETIFWIVLCAALLALESSLLRGTLRTLRTIQAALSSGSHRTLVWIAIGLIGIFSLIEISARVQSAASLISGAITLLLLGSLALSIARMVREKQKIDQQFSEDKVLWLEHLNRQLLLFQVIPLVLARAVSLTGALAAVISGGGTGTLFLPFSLALLLLALQKPSRPDFVTACPACARWMSRALDGLGYCPECVNDPRRTGRSAVQAKELFYDRDTSRSLPAVPHPPEGISATRLPEEMTALEKIALVIAELRRQKGDVPIIVLPRSQDQKREDPPS